MLFHIFICHAIDAIKMWLKNIVEIIPMTLICTNICPWEEICLSLKWKKYLENTISLYIPGIDFLNDILV